ncbi:flagellar biosynthetic protein FliR [Tessaracoccus sp.]
MNLTLQQGTLVALLLGAARAGGFLIIAPPFASRSIPSPVRAAFALLLAVTVLPGIKGQVHEVTTGYLITTAVTEVAIGAAMGFLVAVLFTAVQMAGDLIDVAGGFSLQPGFDPLALTMNSSIGRLHYLIATTLLFTSGGHMIVIRGFVTSYQGLPLGAVLPTDRLGPLLVHTISTMFLSAMQIAGPMLAVLFLSDVALALLSKAAPGLNVFAVGIPLKLTVALTLLSLTIPLLPAAVDALTSDGVRSMLHLSSG